MTYATTHLPVSDRTGASLDQVVRQMLAVTAVQWQLVTPMLRARRKPAKRFDVPAAVRIWVRASAGGAERGLPAQTPCWC